jgi:Flp pilus assembly protein TadG
LKKRGLFKAIWTEESGGILGTVIFLVIVVGIMAAVVVDGTSIYYTYSSASDVTKDAAEAAADNYSNTRSEGRAALVAENFCLQEGIDFINFEIDRESGNLFKVTCGDEAETYVFKHLPYLKDMVYQESTNSARP